MPVLHPAPAPDAAARLDAAVRDAVAESRHHAVESWTAPEPLLPPVWDPDALGWRCPYPHERDDQGRWTGLRSDIDDRRLVAVETVDDWRDIEDHDGHDSMVRGEPPAWMLVGDSNLGDGSLELIQCGNCQGEVDHSALDLDYC